MNFKSFQYIVALLVLFSCKEEESFKDVKIVSHAVSGLYNPQSFYVDNTKEGLHYVLKFEELEGVEIDVQYSLDGSLWMFHDELLQDRTSGFGRVCETTDEVLNNVRYTDVNSTSISPLSSVNWSLNEGVKNIYLDFKYIGSCTPLLYSPNEFITVLNEINQYDGINVFPIINDTAFAHEVHNAGFSVYSDAFSFTEAKEKLTAFYTGVFIRNADVTSSEVANLQINNKKVILFDMFSMKGVREGLEKHPTAILVEDFKSAIIERN